MSQVNSLCFNTQTQQICITKTPLAQARAQNGGVLTTQLVFPGAAPAPAGVVQGLALPVLGGVSGGIQQAYQQLSQAQQAQAGSGDLQSQYNRLSENLKNVCARSDVPDAVYNEARAALAAAAGAALNFDFQTAVNILTPAINDCSLSLA